MIRGVVLDWAGTTIDYGSTAPAQVFVQTFAHAGVQVTLDEARRPMGLPKRDHVREMLAQERIAAQFVERHGRPPAEADVDRLYAQSEQELLRILGDYCEPLPGVLEVVEALRARGVRIGSTTGYTRRMMDELVIPGARRYGYAPDAVVTPDEVPAGRPSPFMCYVNAVRLQLWPLWQCVKVGDTLPDIEEGLNAGMWTVGVALTGNLLGLREAEVNALTAEERQAARERIAGQLYRAGAHAVVDGIWDLPLALARIEYWLSQGERP